MSKGKPVTTGIEKLRELGLDAMELEFVRGVWLKDAKPVKKASEENNIVLTAHGPYYINLASKRKSVREASVKRILRTARKCWEAGGYSVTFHAAYNLASEGETYRVVREALKKITSKLGDEGVSIWVRPETGGKKSQFASTKTLIKLSQELEMVLPCVDFAHAYARSEGGINSYEDWKHLLGELEEGLGRQGLEELHAHFSGITYSSKGERKHVNLAESEFNYEGLAKALKEFNAKGVMVCESPSLEEDALLMKKAFQKV